MACSREGPTASWKCPYCPTFPWLGLPSSRVEELEPLVLLLLEEVNSSHLLVLLLLLCVLRHRNPGRHSPPKSSSIAYPGNDYASSKGDWSCPSVYYRGYGNSSAFCCESANANDVFFRPCCDETSCDRDYDHDDPANENAYDHGIANDGDHASGNGFDAENENACDDHGTANVSNEIAIVCCAMGIVSNGNVSSAIGNVSNGFGNVYANAIVSSGTSNACEIEILNDDPWSENANAIDGGLSSYPWPTFQ